MLLVDARRTIRQQPNPMDKCTIFSIYPKLVDEIHHTIFPGRFIIEAGTYEKPSSLVVGSSSWWKDIDPDQPLVEIPTGSVQVADAVIKNYCSMVGVSGSAKPGLFWIPGEITVAKLKVVPEYVKLLEKAKVEQDNYWQNIINLTDKLWAKSNGNPLVVSDDARLAAKEMGVQGKEWMNNFTMMDMVKCIACGAPRNPLYPVCGNCKTVVDKKRAAELGLIQLEQAK